MVSISAPCLRADSAYATPPLMEVNDQRSLWRRTQALARAAFQLFSYVINKGVEFIFPSPVAHLFLKPVGSVDTGYTYPEQQLPWNATPSPTSEGLFLFVHGLHGHPNAWSGYLKRLTEQCPRVHCVAPYVAQGGNCALETASVPLAAIVRNYAQKYPGKPIHIVGTSNGGRITLDIEEKLEVEQVQGRPLRVVSIAGVHYGTQWINRLAAWKVLRLARFHPAIASDLRWGSAKAQQLLEAWQAKQGQWQAANIDVKHLFCASAEDEQVRPVSSSLPYHHFCEYRLYTGEDHVSIVPKACEDVLQWLNIPRPVASTQGIMAKAYAIGRRVVYACSRWMAPFEEQHNQV